MVLRRKSVGEQDVADQQGAFSRPGAVWPPFVCELWRSATTFTNGGLAPIIEIRAARPGTTGGGGEP